MLSRASRAMLKLHSVCCVCVVTSASLQGDNKDDVETKRESSSEEIVTVDDWTPPAAADNRNNQENNNPQLSALLAQNGSGRAPSVVNINMHKSIHIHNIGLGQKGANLGICPSALGRGVPNVKR